MENRSIDFIQQKTFPECKDKQVLQFDFYLPEYNICIEYDGIQHFESKEYFGGDKQFIITQRHDNIKDEYCMNNNIKMIRIKYNEDVLNKLSYLIDTF